MSGEPAVSPPPSEYQSWKEIAGALQVTVRTAQRWERERGLPVRRIAGSKSQVFLTRAELDKWLAEQDEPVQTPSPAGQASSRRSLWALVFLAAVLGAVLGYFAASPHGPAPAAWRIEGSSFIATDLGGKEIWRKSFSWSLQQTGPGESEHNFVALADIDGDAETEVLYQPVPRVATPQDVPLICYSAAGNEKWRFALNQPEVWAGRFPPPYIVEKIRFVSQHGQRNRIVLAMRHHLEWPAAVVLLSDTGQLLRQYWHPGHLYALETGDPGSDGHTTICAGGVNNARGLATLIVLDPEKFEGAPRDPGREEYRIQTGSPASETARVFFPRACYNRRFEPFNAVTRIQIGSGFIQARVYDSIGPQEVNPYWGGPDDNALSYRLTPGLTLEGLEIPRLNLANHAMLFKLGILDHAFSPADESSLRRIEVLRR